MKNTYTKTEIRISCLLPQVNGPDSKKDKKLGKNQVTLKNKRKRAN